MFLFGKATTLEGKLALGLRLKWAQVHCFASPGNRYCDAHPNAETYEVLLVQCGKLTQCTITIRNHPQWRTNGWRFQPPFRGWRGSELTSSICTVLETLPPSPRQKGSCHQVLSAYPFSAGSPNYSPLLRFIYPFSVDYYWYLIIIPQKSGLWGHVEGSDGTPFAIIYRFWISDIIRWKHPSMHIYQTNWIQISISCWYIPSFIPFPWYWIHANIGTRKWIDTACYITSISPYYIVGLKPLCLWVYPISIPYVWLMGIR